MLYQIWILTFLMVCAVTDLKEQKIFSVFCFANSVIALIIHLLMKDILWTNILFGMILGAAFYVISIFTKEAIGKGDAIVVFTLGCIIGIEQVIKVLILSFFSCSIFSVLGMITKKCRLKTRIPFVPFILLGELIVLLV